MSNTTNTTIKQNFSVLPAYTGVIEYVRKHPGAQATDVAEATNAEISTTRRRLLRLQAEGVLRAERYPKALLFYALEG
ncbi:MAG: winged helix-turn-helix domain-containing protein [Euryarchaeota archaeon]